jgi:spore coat polysaccharide biosynthesis predicted glycosyltransferase SpsG
MIHADAGPFEGWGHLRESIEIARALRDRGTQCLLALPSEQPEAQREVQDAGFAVALVPASDWQQGSFPARLMAVVEEQYATMVISDLVHVNAGYAQAMDQAKIKWATVTEIADEEVANINFNLCTSPEYVPLNSSYRKPASHVVRDNIRQILICYGGSDPRNVTGKTLNWLRAGLDTKELDASISVVVVLGPLFTEAETILKQANEFPVDVVVRESILPAELADAAALSDIAITTSGGTMYEFSALGLPCVVVPILPKHVINAQVLERRGVVLRTDLHDRISALDLISAIQQLGPREKRAAMSYAAQHEIDGMGAARIADRLAEEWGLE